MYSKIFQDLKKLKVSSKKSRRNCAFAHIDSYVKKLEKNIGAKILALSIAVF